MVRRRLPRARLSPSGNGGGGGAAVAVPCAQAHAAFTSLLEKSLQSIDPTVAAHYYDFTLGNGAHEWAAQPFFTSPDLFGPLGDSDAAAHGRQAGELRGGHFAEIPVPRNASQPSVNSWGLVTAPFNNNDASFLTRATSVCGLPTSAMPLPGQ